MGVLGSPREAVKLIEVQVWGDCLQRNVFNNTGTPGLNFRNEVSRLDCALPAFAWAFGSLRGHTQFVFSFSACIGKQDST